MRFYSHIKLKGQVSRGSSSVVERLKEKDRVNILHFILEVSNEAAVDDTKERLPKMNSN